MNVYDFDNTIYDGESVIDFFLYYCKKDKSLIGKTNRLLGALFGFVKSIIVVCALVAVINFFIPYSNSENGIVQTASESVLFNAFNQYNPINFITRGA